MTLEHPDIQFNAFVLKHKGCEVNMKRKEYSSITVKCLTCTSCTCKMHEVCCDSHTLPKGAASFETALDMRGRLDCSSHKPHRQRSYNVSC